MTNKHNPKTRMRPILRKPPGPKNSVSQGSHTSQFVRRHVGSRSLTAEKHRIHKNQFEQELTSLTEEISSLVEDINATEAELKQLELGLGYKEGLYWEKDAQLTTLLNSGRNTPPGKNAKKQKSQFNMLFDELNTLFSQITQLQRQKQNLAIESTQNKDRLTVLRARQRELRNMSVQSELPYEPPFQPEQKYPSEDINYSSALDSIPESRNLFSGPAFVWMKSQPSRFVESPIKHTLGTILGGPKRIVGTVALLSLGSGLYKCTTNALLDWQDTTWKTAGKDVWAGGKQFILSIPDYFSTAGTFVYNNANEISLGVAAIWAMTSVVRPTAHKKVHRLSLGTSVLAINYAVTDMSHNFSEGARQIMDFVQFKTHSTALAGTAAALYFLSFFLSNEERARAQNRSILKGLKTVPKSIKNALNILGEGMIGFGRDVIYVAKDAGKSILALLPKDFSFGTSKSVLPTQTMPICMEPKPEGDAGQTVDSSNESV